MEHIEEVVDSFEFSVDAFGWLEFEHPSEFFEYGTYAYMEHIKHSVGVSIRWNDLPEHIKEKIEFNLADQWDSFVSDSE